MRLGILAGVALLAFALATSAFAQDATRVGFIYAGAIDDGGPTEHYHSEALGMATEFDGGVELMFREEVPFGQAAEDAMTELARDGAQIIFTASYGYADAAMHVAENFPDVKFEIAEGSRTAPNAATYAARSYQGRAVEGYIAGKMTKTNKVGYIASFPIPSVIQGINAAFVEARKVNPEVSFDVVWVFAAYDPAKEADAANALIANGADVLMQDTGSTAPQAAAAHKGNVFTFGQFTDMAEYAPLPRLTSVIENRKAFYASRVQAVKDGTWQSGSTWGGLSSGMVELGPLSNALPADVAEGAAALRDGIASGDYQLMAGPLLRQDGVLWFREGESPDDEDLQAMDYFLWGIDAAIPY